MGSAEEATLSQGHLAHAVTVHGFGQAKIDDLHRDAAVILVMEHDVGGLDVAVDQFLFVSRHQGAGHLESDVEGHAQGQRSVTAEAGIDGFAIDELHGVEIGVVLVAEVEHGGDVGMAQPGGGAGFPEETLAYHLAVEEGGVDHFQHHVEAQVGVEGLVSDPHRSAAEFMKRAVRLAQNFVMLKFFRLGHC